MALPVPQFQIRNYQRNINTFRIEARRIPETSCTKIVPMVGCIDDSDPVGET